MSSTPARDGDVDQLAINTLRFLAVDMVEKAKSGHPGAPLGQAPMAYLLWTRFLRHDPADPLWPNRDRFILSCGHASALLYGLLHLAGYDLSVAELERFRQLDSKTPGHPEFGHTPGVETTTGPLGQGFANAVGMAIAREQLAAPLPRRRRLRSSTSAPGCLPPTATSWRASRARPPRSPGTSGSAASRCSTTRTASRSTARPTWLSPNRSIAVSLPTAGT